MKYVRILLFIYASRTLQKNLPGLLAPCCWHRRVPGTKTHPFLEGENVLPATLYPLVTSLCQLQVCPRLHRLGSRLVFHATTGPLVGSSASTRNNFSRRDTTTAWFCAFGCSPKMPRKHSDPFCCRSSGSKPLAKRGHHFSAFLYPLTV